MRWLDGMRTISMGMARHCKESNTWTFTGEGYGPHGKSTVKGTVKFLDPDTMEWNMTEFAMGGLVKNMEMTGIGRRR